MSVHVSASPRVSIKEIEAILIQKADFILSAINKYEEKLKSRKEKRGDDENFVNIFGKRLSINILSGDQNQAQICEDGIFVTLKNVKDKAALENTVQKILDRLCINTVDQLCRKIYPEFENYVPSFPEIKYRHMTSRWGSCNYKKRVLTFNYHLIHAPLDCIKYVVYHEFTHFIHPNHSKEFYSALSEHLPRHKELKSMLQKTDIPLKDTQK